jgi:hypothetical protein
MSIYLHGFKSKVNRERFIRVVAITTIVIAAQNILPSPKAEANILTDIGAAVSANYLWDVGKAACGTRCAVVATAATVIVYNYGPSVVQSSVDYAKPGLIEMFTNWGSTFFRP